MENQEHESQKREDQKCEDQQYDPLGGCLVRLFWMMFGNVILLFCAFTITQDRLFGLSDVSYWFIVGCLLAARYIDIEHFKGLTSDGIPASMAHWRRYAVFLVAASTGIWIAAHALAHFRV